MPERREQPQNFNAYEAIARQEQRNSEQIEDMRRYFLSKLDAIADLVNRHVSRDELARELGRIHEEIANIKIDVRGQMDGVKGDVVKVMTRIEAMEAAILARQKENYQRVIRIQAALLSPIFIAIIIYVLQAILHNFLPH